MSKCTLLTLPIPPSTNALYVNVRGRGRVKSDVYREWIRWAGLELIAQKPKRIAGDYELVLRVPRNLRGDIDNRLKAVSDLLVRHGVTADDSRAFAQCVRRTPDLVGCVSVEVCEVAS